MTREELKWHCLKQIEGCEMWARLKGEEPHGEIYEEHKLILELLEQGPRKGHWIPIYQGDEIIDYRCSECEFGNTFGKGTIGMNFCPRCGSDNREAVEK